LNEWLEHIDITHDGGRTPVPSLVALWLLQLALAHRGEMSFDLLLRAVVLDPLDMGGTRSGCDDSLAGALDPQTSAHDLLSFLQAFLAPLGSALGETIAMLLRVKNAGGLEHPIGWACSPIDHAFASQRYALTWIDGWTPGCRTFFGFSRRDHTAAVIAAFTDSRHLRPDHLNLAEHVGFHVLDHRWPMPALR
jgi:hypothetical protein